MNTVSAIALVGPRAVGKSTLAAALAQRLGWSVVDTDLRIAERAGRPAGAFLAEAGEPAFRAMERSVCSEALAVGPSRVVALGGGAVLSASVRRRLLEADVFTVLLEAELADLVARQRGGGLRPPLTDLPLEEEVAAVLAERRALYDEVARMRVNTSTSNVDACVVRIWCKMRAMQRGPG